MKDTNKVYPMDKKLRNYFLGLIGFFLFMMSLAFGIGYLAGYIHGEDECEAIHGR